MIRLFMCIRSLVRGSKRGSNYQVDLPFLDPAFVTTLEALFEKDEIREALMEADGEKEPRLYGFPFHFA